MSGICNIQMYSVHDTSVQCELMWACMFFSLAHFLLNVIILNCLLRHLRKYLSEIRL